MFRSRTTTPIFHPISVQPSGLCWRSPAPSAPQVGPAPPVLLEILVQPARLVQRERLGPRELPARLVLLDRREAPARQARPEPPARLAQLETLAQRERLGPRELPARLELPALREVPAQPAQAGLAGRRPGEGRAGRGEA